jgi:L-aminopeptidase/D-esterase-like protein
VFDLAPLGRFDARPTANMAYDACTHASSRHVAEGSVGAGTGALVGKGAGVERAMKGGVGAGVAAGADQLVAAIAAVNAFGDVRDAHGDILAGARADGGGFVDVEARMRAGVVSSRLPTTREHTTIACVAVRACLNKMQLAQVAAAATTALRKRISPAATSFDGDVVFVIGPCTGDTAPLPVVEALAIAALEQAIERAVRLARGRDGFPGLGDSTLAAGAV